METTFWYVRMGSKILDIIEAKTQKEALAMAHKKYGIEIINALMSVEKR